MKNLIASLFLIFFYSCGQKVNQSQEKIQPYKPVKPPTGISGDLLIGNNSLVLPNTEGPIGVYIFKYNPIENGAIKFEFADTFLLRPIGCTLTSERVTTKPLVNWRESINGDSKEPVTISLNSNQEIHINLASKYILEIQISNLNKEYSDCKNIEVLFQTTRTL